MLEATDATATRLAPGEREAMRRHFVTTSRYEWMFEVSSFLVAGGLALAGRISSSA